MKMQALGVSHYLFRPAATDAACDGRGACATGLLALGGAALAAATAAALAAAVALAVAATTDLVSSAPSLFRAVHQGVYHGSLRNDDDDDVQRIQRDG